MLAELGEAARQRFIRANLRLVAMVARQIGRSAATCPQADLYQEGCVGLDHRGGALRLCPRLPVLHLRAVLDPRVRRRLGGPAAGRAEPADQPGRAVAGGAGGRGGAGAAVGAYADGGRGRRRVGAQRGVDRGPARPPAAAVAGGPGRHGDRPARPARQLPGRRVRPGPVRELLGRLEDLDRQVLELRLGFADGEPRSFAHTARVLAISATRVRRLEARALETLRGVCPQQASAHLCG